MPGKLPGEKAPPAFGGAGVRSSQAKFSQKLLPHLTEEEQQAYQRGRNAHVNHVPKSASVADYHAATAFEALFGYLYLSGKTERLRELFAICMEE